MSTSVIQPAYNVSSTGYLQVQSKEEEILKATQDIKSNSQQASSLFSDINNIQSSTTPATPLADGTTPFQAIKNVLGDLSSTLNQIDDVNHPDLNKISDVSEALFGFIHKIGRTLGQAEGDKSVPPASFADGPSNPANDQVATSKPFESSKEFIFSAAKSLNLLVKDDLNSLFQASSLRLSKDLLKQSSVILDSHSAQIQNDFQFLIDHNFLSSDDVQSNIQNLSEVSRQVSLTSLKAPENSVIGEA